MRVGVVYLVVVGFHRLPALYTPGHAIAERLAASFSAKEPSPPPGSGGGGGEDAIPLPSVIAFLGALQR